MVLQYVNILQDPSFLGTNNGRTTQVLELVALNKWGWIVFERFSQGLKVEWNAMKNQSIDILFNSIKFQF